MPTPGSQLALFATYSYHGCITDREGGHPGTGGRPPLPRRDRERHPRPQVRRGTEPSPLGALRRQRSLAGGAGDGPQPGSLDGAHRSGRACGDHQDPPTTVLLPRRTAHPARRAASLCICHSVGPGKPSSVTPWHDCVPSHSQPDGAVVAGSTHRATHRPRQLAPTRSARDTSCLPPIDPAPHMAARPPSSCQCGCLTPPSSPSIGIWPGPFAFPYPSSHPCTHHPWYQRQGRLASVDSG